MRRNFIIINTLKIFAVVLNNLQISPSSCFYFIRFAFLSSTFRHCFSVSFASPMAVYWFSMCTKQCLRLFFHMHFVSLILRPCSNSSYRCVSGCRQGRCTYPLSEYSHGTQACVSQNHTACIFMPKLLCFFSIHF